MHDGDAVTSSNAVIMQFPDATSSARARLTLQGRPGIA